MKKMLLWIVTLAPLVFAGCGGGGGGGGLSSGGSGGIVAGKITGFGSVHVNNRRLLTDNNTEVQIGDDSRTPDGTRRLNQNDLKVGQIAVIDEKNGLATRIKVDENVKGPIDSVSPLVVMGQNVVQDAQTIVDNSCPSPLTGNEVLEVFGFSQPNGDILARLIECKTPAGVKRYSVIGKVSNINGQQFSINGLTVDFSGADTTDLPGGQPTDGQLVEVKDDAKGYSANSFFLSASKVEPQVGPRDLAAPNQKIEIETLVTDTSGLPNAFQMGDLTVTIPAGFSNFLFGTSGNILVGAEVEVEGRIDANGNLVASKIKFEDNSLRVQGAIDVVNGNTVTLLGSVEVTIPATLTVPAQGAVVEIKGFEGANGKFIASEVKTSNDNKTFLRGPASSADLVNNTVKILGVTVHFDATTEFHEHNGQANIGATAFFALVTDGLTSVKARWDNFTSTSDIAKELEIEDE